MTLHRTLRLAAVALLAVTGVAVSVSARPFMHLAGKVASASSVELVGESVGESWCEQQCNNAPNAAACMARCRRSSVASASGDNSDASSSSAALVGGVKCYMCEDQYYQCVARVTADKMKNCREQEAQCRRTCNLVSSVPTDEKAQASAPAATVGESWCEQQCNNAPNAAACMARCRRSSVASASGDNSDASSSSAALVGGVKCYMCEDQYYQCVARVTADKMKNCREQEAQCRRTCNLVSSVPTDEKAQASAPAATVGESWCEQQCNNAPNAAACMARCRRSSVASASGDNSDASSSSAALVGGVKCYMCEDQYYQCVARVTADKMKNCREQEAQCRRTCNLVSSVPTDEKAQASAPAATVGESWCEQQCNNAPNAAACMARCRRSSVASASGDNSDASSSSAALVGGVKCYMCEDQYYQCVARVTADKMKNCREQEAQCRRTCNLVSSVPTDEKAQASAPAATVGESWCEQQCNNAPNAAACMARCRRSSVASASGDNSDASSSSAALVGGVKCYMCEDQYYQCVARVTADKMKNCREQEAQCRRTCNLVSSVPTDEKAQASAPAATVGESWCEQQCNNAPNAAACMARCRRSSVASASGDNSDASSSSAALVGGVKCYMCEDQYYQCVARVTADKMKNCREQEAQCRRTCNLVSSVPTDEKAQASAPAATVGESWCEQQCNNAPNAAACMARCRRSSVASASGDNSDASSSSAALVGGVKCYMCEDQYYQCVARVTADKMKNCREQEAQCRRTCNLVSSVPTDEKAQASAPAATVGESWCEQQCNNAPNAAACMARCRRSSVASASGDNSDASSSSAALVGGVKCYMCEDQYYQCVARVTADKMKNCREQEAQCRRTCNLVSSVPTDEKAQASAPAATVGESWCEQQCNNAPNAAACMARCRRSSVASASECHGFACLNVRRLASTSACERCISDCGASLSCVFVSCRPICPTEVSIGAAVGQRSSVGAIPFTCDWDYENCMSTYAQTHSEFTKKYCADAYQSCKSSVSVTAAKPTQVGVF